MNKNRDSIKEIQALITRANNFISQNNILDAEKIYHHILTIDKKNIEAILKIALIMFNTNRKDQAIQFLKNYNSKLPNNTNLLINLATFLKDTKQLNEAIKFYSDALKISSNNADLITAIGICYFENEEYIKALEYYQKVQKINPNHTVMLNNLAITYKVLNLYKEANEAYKKALEISASPVILTNLLNNLHYDPAISNQELFNYHKKFEELFAKNVIPFTGNKISTNRNKKIRIGYLTGALFPTPLSFFFEPVITNHDKEKFEIYAYSNCQNFSPEDKIIIEHFDNFKDISQISDRDFAKLVQQDQIDIFVDLLGHTKNGRLLAFAYKAAPIQISWMGYFNTTGMDSIDYFITDKIHTPENLQEFYSEKLLYMPDCYIPFIPAKYLPKNEKITPARKNGYITFGSFNNSVKVNNEVIKLWSEILKQVPNSKLYIKAHNLHIPLVKENLLKSFALNEINEERLIMEGYTPHKEMVHDYLKADIALDPFPFPGGLTSLETLYLGVPIVTLAMDRTVSRQTVTYLHHIDIKELITYTKEEYVSKAVSLASNLDYLEELRQKINNNFVNSPLMDGNNFTKNLEKIYIDVWHKK